MLFSIGTGSLAIIVGCIIGGMLQSYGIKHKNGLISSSGGWSLAGLGFLITLFLWWQVASHVSHIELGGFLIGLIVPPAILAFVFAG
jgi:uncharacterized membrane protein